MGKRGRGTGHLYEKYGSYYGRWRTLDGRLLNRLIGPARTPGESDGLTRSQAERAFRKLQEAEEGSPRPVRGATVPSLDEVADSLRRRLALRGARRSYLEGCESMQRVHLSPRLGATAVSELTTGHVEALAAAMLEAGLAPKTVRNVLTFLHSVSSMRSTAAWSARTRSAARHCRAGGGRATPIPICSSSRSRSSRR
jgi:hypothetical protein